MFFFIPYKSDVAARQFVWGTVGVIAANLLVALLLGFPSETLPAPGDAVFVDHWVLHFGTINPLEWFTSAFSHFGWFHLAFNMIFLWAFGFVVESLLGWRRFLQLYAALVAAHGCLTQLVMLGATGGAAGASGMVYALMAIAAMWAPRNELTVFVWVLTIVRSQDKTTVLTFCAIFVGLDLLWVFLQGFAMSSELLHVFGALVGGGAAWLMLDKGMVDTEGWDIFSLRRARPAAGRAARDDEPRRGRRAGAVAADRAGRGARRVGGGAARPRGDRVRTGQAGQPGLGAPAAGATRARARERVRERSWQTRSSTPRTSAAKQ